MDLYRNILVGSLIGDSTTAKVVLSYLKKSYNSIPVEPSHLINEFGYSIPFHGREDLLLETKKLFDFRWQNRTTRDGTSHKIGIIGGCSGIGKSRALVEIAKSIVKWKIENQWCFQIVISYNNDNPPILDRLLSSASTALAFRILYFSFIAGNKSIHQSFETFVNLFPKMLMVGLTPEIAIQAVELHMYEQCGHSNGVIFIGLDEVDNLLGEEDNRSFMKSTLIALKGVMLIPDKFIFVVIAAKTILPIKSVFDQYGLVPQLLPIKLLRGDQCEKIVEEMVPFSSAEWRSCRAFRTLLADFGSLPRKAEIFLSLVNIKLSEGIALVDIDYETIGCQLIGTSSSFPATVGKLAELAEHLVSDILLATKVKRENIVDVAVNDFTYGELESLGVIALETSIDTHLTVQMPYYQFRALVEIMNGEDPLTKSLRKICNIVQCEEEFGMLSWQTFEDFNVKIEACREMLTSAEKYLTIHLV